MADTPDETVRSVMTTRVVAILPGATLETALKLMAETRVRHLPVVDGDQCVGLLHEADLLWTLWTHGPTNRTVADCYRQPAPIVTAADPLTTAAAHIHRAGGDATLVTDNGALVGILTATDIVGYLAQDRVGR